MKKTFLVLTAMLFIVTGFAQKKTIYIAAEKAPCTGVAPMQCLQYRYAPTESWKLLYGGIEGFSHESGYEYTLLIKEQKIKNPPADGSNIKRILVKVIAQTKSQTMSNAAVNGTWTIKELRMDGLLSTMAAQPFSILITDSMFSAKLCNNLNGKLHFNNDGSFKAGMVRSTRMMCPDMINETSFLKALENANRYTLKNETLTLYTNDEVLAIFSRNTDQAEKPVNQPAHMDTRAMLEQTTWKVITIKDDIGLTEMLDAGATMKFDIANKRVAGKGGCNNYFAQADILFATENNGSLKMSKVGSTLMACPKNMDLESRLFRLLEKADAFDLKDGNLLIKSGATVIITLQAS